MSALPEKMAKRLPKRSERCGAGKNARMEPRECAERRRPRCWVSEADVKGEEGERKRGLDRRAEMREEM